MKSTLLEAIASRGFDRQLEFLQNIACVSGKAAMILMAEFGPDLSDLRLRATGKFKSWTESKTIPFKLIPLRAETVAPPLAEAA
ncbi:MAG: hypothetical protein LBV23_10055 [Deltaproteobacteria bacterium]|nr:hypothetical protein [Deltaproteobacteria bacterium]